MVYEQDLHTPKNILELRKLTRVRETLNIHGTHKMPDVFHLNYTKPRHQEVAIAQLVGTVHEGEGRCNRCAAKGGFFHECISVPAQDGKNFLRGWCANCLLKNQECSFVQKGSDDETEEDEEANEGLRVAEDRKIGEGDLLDEGGLPNEDDLVDEGDMRNGDGMVNEGEMPDEVDMMDQDNMVEEG
ncbi:MAG: hypothetical protein Q9204_000970 [Flavoplaca sp. TL-2023a]